jgi:hypothetical protein
MNFAVWRILKWLAARTIVPFEQNSKKYSGLLLAVDFLPEDRLRSCYAFGKSDGHRDLAEQEVEGSGKKRISPPGNDPKER